MALSTVPLQTKTAAMIVSFPFTNPVAFNHEGLYHNYSDAFGMEQVECYVQPWCSGDIVSWQVCWYRRSTAYSTDVRIEIEVNGERRLFRQYTGIQGDVSGGAFYTTYYVSRMESAAFSNGYYVFSDTIENVTDSHSQRMLQEGDRFRFVVTVSGKTYVSGPQVFAEDREGTKLLHYTDTRKRLFDTQFSAVQKGYEIRLQAVFEHPEPVANMEFMESYERDIELVSAVPAENIVLEIGGNRGIPDHLVRNLNHILHCDTKSIDGVRYELTPDAKVTPERVEGYNPAFLSVGMAKSRSEFSLCEGSADRKIVPFIVVGGNEVIHILVKVDPQVHWYLDDFGTGMLIDADVSQWNGIGPEEVTVSLPVNTSGKPVEWRIRIMDRFSGKALEVFSHVQLCMKLGIGYGIVEDNFFVRKRTQETVIR